MAIERRRQVGRRYKGDRVAVLTRLPLPEAERLFKLVERSGATRTDFVSAVLHAYLVEIDEPDDRVIDGDQHDERCPLCRRSLTHTRSEATYA